MALTGPPLYWVECENDILGQQGTYSQADPIIETVSLKQLSLYG